MKKIVLVFIAFFISGQVFCQQYALYHTKTLFDAFENPSMRAFQADSSKKYATNMFFPTMGFNAAIVGPAQETIRSSFFTGVSNTENLELGSKQINHLISHTNVYLAMFRIFKTEVFNTEMGFSWQLRNDANAAVTNETFALLKTYTLFKDNPPVNLFNNSGYNQSYHQVSFTYREDYNRRLSLGVKFSILNGITYNKLAIRSSSLSVNEDENSFTTHLAGTLSSSFKYGSFDNKAVLPLMQNPGFSVGLSANYKFKSGVFMLANLKDIGFIAWGKKSYKYEFNNTIVVNSTNTVAPGAAFRNELDRMIRNADASNRFITPTNGRAEVLLSKSAGFFHPNLIVSKNIIDKGGDLALVNNFYRKNWVYSATVDYNFYKYFQIGGQVMYKTPNIEGFIGSDQLFKTVESVNGYFTKNDAGSGYTGASIYMGFAFKFGPDVEHPHNANSIPGFAENERSFKGVFRGIFNRLQFWRKRSAI